MASDPFDDLGRRKRSAELIENTVVFESDDCGDGADSESGSEALVLFGVDFDKLCSKGEVPCRFFEGRCHAPARPAPRSPEIGDDKPFVVDQEAIETLFVEGEGFCLEKRAFAMAAESFRIALFDRYGIDPPALRADDRHFPHLNFFNDLDFTQRSGMMVFDFVVQAAERFVGPLDRFVDGGIEIFVAIGDDDGLSVGDVHVKLDSHSVFLFGDHDVDGGDVKVVTFEIFNGDGNMIV